MQSIHIAEHFPHFSPLKHSRAKKELVIIVAILALGLIGISTCLLDDASTTDYTIQQMNVTSLSMR